MRVQVVLQVGRQDNFISKLWRLEQEYHMDTGDEPEIRGVPNVVVEEVDATPWSPEEEEEPEDGFAEAGPLSVDEQTDVMREASSTALVNRGDRGGKQRGERGEKGERGERRDRVMV
jgi:hypothetical protein